MRSVESSPRRGVRGLSGMWRALAASTAPLRARMGVGRVGFAMLVCVLVSTQAWFQPTLYQPFVLEGWARSWLDYLGECLLMGMPIMVTLTLVEALAPGKPRLLAVPVVVAALATGATAGAVALIPYYDLPPESAFDGRFVSDVVYWMLIGGAAAVFYAIQRRTASASAALHEARLQQIALGKQMLEAQLQVMRAQIEPHFLFNTLANVKRLANTDAEASRTLLDNLTHYLRAALPRMREDRGTLGQEVELVRAYLDVLRVRMGARLRYAIDVPSTLTAEPFPPMMLLTLVENALKHGIDPSPGGGTIAVRAARDRGDLAVCVADTGVGFGRSVSGGTGVGLANARARLSALYGDAASLELAANEPTGVIATLRIPGTTLASGASIDSPLAAAGLQWR